MTFESLVAYTNKISKTAILVAGMNRSGNSAVARVLNLLGCDLPKTLIPPRPNNPQGFWESEAIVALNDAILASAGSAWDDWEAFDQDWYTAPAVDEFRECARAALEREFEGSRLFVLKDPRLCRLLRFWIETVEAFGATPLLVSPIRNPLEVAASLTEQNGMDPTVAQLFWLRHVLDAEAASRQQRRAYVRYDALLTEWRVVADRLGRELGLSWPSSSAAVAGEIEAFLSPTQRHHSENEARTFRDPALSHWIKSSFEILNRWTHGEARGTDTADLDRIRSAFNEAAPTFRRSIAAARHAGRSGRALEAKTGELEAELKAREAEVEELRGMLESKRVEQQTQAKELRAQLKACERDLQRLLTSKSWRLTKPLRKIYDTLWPGRNGMSNRFRHEEFARTSHTTQAHTSPFSAYYDYLSDLNNAPAAHYIEQVQRPWPDTDMKVIAFYLPQFHPVPENNLWWGNGFTEWTNVSRALPQFRGQYQPRLPADLGFYDLRIPEVQRRQIDMAQQAGIYGFCFHFYWFGGKTLLESPLEQFLEVNDAGFPFCLNWANENWSRRWDGSDAELLRRQQHSPKDDLEFIRHVSRYLADPRYIRIEGRPLLVVYRPALLPDARATAERWRQWCRDNGIGELYLALTHSFEHLDPQAIGFEAAIEFAPNTFPLRDITGLKEWFNPKFSGRVLDYASALDIARRYQTPPYRKFRGICPQWDNEARRPGHGLSLANSSPDLYGHWLDILCDFTAKRFRPEERFIFLNAWNEWAEGAYLEPDRRYGHAYLNATAEVLQRHSRGSTFTPAWTILFVSHDACTGGAQAVLLNLLSWITRHTLIDAKVLCLQGGEWLPRFQAVADTRVLSGLAAHGGPDEEIVEALRTFCGGEPKLIFANSLATGSAFRLLRRLKVPILTHVLELNLSIQHYAKAWINEILQVSTHFLACSRSVMDNLVRNYGVDPGSVSIVYPSIRHFCNTPPEEPEGKRELRRRLGVKLDAFIVMGCGVGLAWLKGADLFVEVARLIYDQGIHEVQFYWVGAFSGLGRNDTTENKFSWAMTERGPLPPNVTVLGVQNNPREYFRAADVFLFPSREDSFGLVVLEAAECGLPTICFDNAGGAPEHVKDDAGYVVPYEDTAAMAANIIALRDDPTLVARMGHRARERALANFTLEQTAPLVLAVCRRVAKIHPAVSVIVPNHNHAQFLVRRLESIAAQTFKDCEIILLDDASTDDSVAFLEDFAQRADVQLVVNQQNSGAPFRQWLKGLELAQGELVWVAEPDDVSEPEFLETLVAAFRDPSVRLAYTGSHVINENGRIIGDYRDTPYLADLSGIKWHCSYTVPADQEVNDGLGVKNTILNAGSTLMRRFPIDAALRQNLQNMRLAGDWYIFLHAIRGGRVRYVDRKLNGHRHPDQSVMAGAVHQERLRELFGEMETVHRYVLETFALDTDFRNKWEHCLRQMWVELSTGRPFEELTTYYAVEELRQKLALTSGTRSPTVEQTTHSHASSQAELNSHSGFCPICGPTEFVTEGSWLRDDYRCLRCRSIPRWRALVLTLDREFPNWRHMKIHESSPGGAASDKFARECAYYSMSHYFPNVPRGKCTSGIRCEDLEQLTFADDSFDLFITQDVLEHVFDAAAALREIERVVQPGGAHIFTVPMYQRDETVIRAKRNPQTGNIEHLLDPDYHRNPIDPSGSLVVREWGRDIVQFIRNCVEGGVDVYSFYNPLYGLDGEFLNVFVMRNKAR